MTEKATKENHGFICTKCGLNVGGMALEVAYQAFIEHDAKCDIQRPSIREIEASEWELLNSQCDGEV